MVHHSAEIFGGFALPSLALGREILASLEASSGVGVIFSYILFFSFSLSLADGLTGLKY